jgi:organic hydroperoxide reductase OsmC/OhrA
VRGTLDRVEGGTRFTEFVVEAALAVPEGTDRDKAAKVMERAEHVCLISNSHVAERRLVATVSAG